MGCGFRPSGSSTSEAQRPFGPGTRTFREMSAAGRAWRAVVVTQFVTKQRDECVPKYCCSKIAATVGADRQSILMISGPPPKFHPVQGRRVCRHVYQHHRYRCRRLIEQKHQSRHPCLGGHVELQLGVGYAVVPSRHWRVVAETDRSQVDVTAKHLRPAHLR